MKGRMSMFLQKYYTKIIGSLLILGALMISAVSCLAAEFENSMRIATVNFQPIWGDKKANLNKMVEMTKQAADNGAQLVLFPEMCLTGYAMEQDNFIKRSERMQVKLAEEINGESAKIMAQTAKENKVYVVYGYPERIGKDPLNVYNSAVAISSSGEILGSYRKVHPFGSEVIWAKTGTEPFMFDSPWGKIGISICYDTYNYPELSRFYVAKGAKIILNPTATSWGYYSASELENGQPLNDGKPINGNNKAWLNRFKNRIEAVTTQNGVFLVTSDLIGAERKADGTFMGTAFPGGSCVVGPTDDKKGTMEYISYYGTNPETSVDEGIIYSDLNLENAKRNSFTNYIKTELQEGNLYQPSLYEKWFKDLKKDYKSLY